MHYGFITVAAFFGACAYRLRGGGWISTGSSTLCKVIWCAAMLAMYAVVAFPVGAPWYIVYFIVAVYVAQLVPHAFAQNMGTWPTPQKSWPAFFLPTLTDAEWSAMPMWARTAYDFGGMLGVGFFRGLIVFGGIAGQWAILHNHMPFSELLTGAVNAVRFPVAVITIGQPIAYLVGKFTPFTITSALVARTNTWGEFFNGAAWAFALAIL